LFRRRGCEHTFVTHPAYLREKARTLRIERSLTIDEIAERLALPRTTIFYWVRDLPIARRRRPPVIASRARAMGNRAMQAKYRLARDAAYAEGRATFASLATDPTFRDFVCLYLVSRRGRNEAQVCNSDPAVVRVCDGWAAAWRSVHGVLAVAVYDTLLRARLQGWMDCLRETWS
jgi:hypothetical protein